MTRLTAALPALLLAGSVALSGCGGDPAGPTDERSSETAPESAPEVSPAAVAAADWLGGQLTDGLVVNEQYDVADVGLSIDVALGLADVDPATAAAVGDAVTEPRTLAGYVGDPDTAAYAGATAKAAVLATTLDLDPTDVGGLDLPARLEGLVSTEGPTAGRVVDAGPDDFANVVGQTFAVRALDGAGDGDLADDVSAFLVQQQCDDGGFRSTFSAPRAADQGCGDADVPDTDTTALAVVALLGRDDDEEAAAAAEEALSWLLAEQEDDGSFAGGVVGAQDDPVPNANSTGLAGQALALAGEDDAAGQAARWVSGLQVDADAPGPLAEEVGAVAYDQDALDRGAGQGITVPQQDQWRRTTAQAVLALAAVPGA